MELAKQINEYYDKQERAPRKREYFYVSEAGMTKKELYKKLTEKKSRKFDAKLKRILSNGNYVHERFMKVFAEMGILVAAEIVAVENDIVHGRADCILSDKGKLYVADIKSCNMWTFNKLDRPMTKHEYQLQFYMYFLNIPRGMLLYENKNDQTIKVFDLELDKELVENELQKMTEVLHAIDNGNEVEDDKPLTVEDLVYGI